MIILSQISQMGSTSFIFFLLLAARPQNGHSVVAANANASKFQSIRRSLASALVGATMIGYSNDVALAGGSNLRIAANELHSVFDEWDPSIFRDENFDRLDSTDDAKFYSIDRFVEHIDNDAVKTLVQLHDKRLSSLSLTLYGGNRHVDVLDLCSSWTSHLPLNMYPAVSSTTGSSDVKYVVAGLGMNQQELDSNPQLTQRVVEDLNKGHPKLPWTDNSFDAVLLQLSIDYLTKPTEVLKEAARVLRPGGEVMISFSNRLFFDKAVAIWTGKSDIEHIETVGNYLHFSSDDWQEPFLALDLSPSASKGDPLFAVVARKR